jgi:hypothetical protein
MQGGQSKYTGMLDDRDVARWFGQVSQGSKKTGKVYLRRLGYACERYHTTPHDVARLDRRGYGLSCGHARRRGVEGFGINQPLVNELLQN